MYMNKKKYAKLVCTIQCTCNLLSHLTEKIPEKTNVNPQNWVTTLKWHGHWGKWHKKDILCNSARHQLFWNDLIRFKFHFVRQMTIWFSTNWKPQIQTFIFYLPNFILHGIKRLSRIMRTWSSFLSDWVPVFLPFHCFVHVWNGAFISAR